MSFGNDKTIGFGNASDVTVTKITVVGPGQGIFVYNGSVALGNLIETDGIESAGTDSKGNAYLAGGTSYSNGGGIWFASSNSGGIVAYYVSTAGPGGPYTLVASVGLTFVGSAGHISIQSTDGVGVELNGQDLTIPQGITGSIQSLPHDNNSGSTWVSGERAFMNSNWIDVINSNFAAIQQVLTDSGVAI